MAKKSTKKPTKKNNTKTVVSSILSPTFPYLPNMIQR